jgi:hypothetical protein
MPYPFFRQNRTIYWNESFAIVQSAHGRMIAENPPRFDKDGAELTSNPPGPIQWADEHPTRLTSGHTGSQHDLKPGDCLHAWRLNA